MAKQFELTSEMKEKIGWKSPPWKYEVTTTGVRAFARGVGYKDLVYYDVAAAKEAGYRNLPAPVTYVGMPIFMPGECDPVTTGPDNSVIDLKTGLPGIIDGGTEIEYFEPICAGDTLTAVNQLAALETKESKAMGVMLIEKYETAFHNDQTGKLVAIMRMQFIRF